MVTLGTFVVEERYVRGCVEEGIGSLHQLFAISRVVVYIRYFYYYNPVRINLG